MQPSRPGGRGHPAIWGTPGKRRRQQHQTNKGRFMQSFARTLVPAILFLACLGAENKAAAQVSDAGDASRGQILLSAKLRHLPHHDPGAWQCGDRETWPQPGRRRWPARRHRLELQLHESHGRIRADLGCRHAGSFPHESAERSFPARPCRCLFPTPRIAAM